MNLEEACSMARPLDPTAPYRISIHNIGGYRYASTQPAYQDPETGKTKHKRIHWGTYCENIACQKFRAANQRSA